MLIWQNVASPKWIRYLHILNEAHASLGHQLVGNVNINVDIVDATSNVVINIVKCNVAFAVVKIFGQR